MYKINKKVYEIQKMIDHKALQAIYDDIATPELKCTLVNSKSNYKKIT